MKKIAITTLVDVSATLANNSLQGNINILDNNRLSGSLDEGTDVLKTTIKKDDTLVWTTFGLEVESFVEISNISIDPLICEPVKKYYIGTNIPYWIATIKKDLLEEIPYSLSFLVGNNPQEFSTINGPFLFTSN